MTLVWSDPNIRTNTNEDEKIILSPDAVKKIWTPDIYVWNRTTITTVDRWASLIQSRIFRNGKDTNVELQYEIKTTVYCIFEYSKYLIFLMISYIFR